MRFPRATRREVFMLPRDGASDLCHEVVLSCGPAREIGNRDDIERDARAMMIPRDQVGGPGKLSEMRRGRLL